MGRQRYAARGQNTTNFRDKKTRLGPISNTVMLIVLACLLGLMYLTQVTKTNAYSYRINELQTQADKLKSEHAELEVASARLQSLERVKNSAQAKSLVATAPVATLQ
jgi:cell division protein FtsL